MTFFLARRRRSLLRGRSGNEANLSGAFSRSRNAAVDECLQTDSEFDGDTFADVEDFHVPG